MKRVAIATLREWFQVILSEPFANFEKLSEEHRQRYESGDMFAWFEFLLIAQCKRRAPPDWVVDGAIEFFEHGISKGVGGKKGRGNSAASLFKRDAQLNARLDAVKMVLAAQRRLHLHDERFDPAFYKLAGTESYPEVNGKPVLPGGAGSTDQRAFEYASELLERSIGHGDARAIRSDWKKYRQGKHRPGLGIGARALGWW